MKVLNIHETPPIVSRCVSDWSQPTGSNWAGSITGFSGGLLPVWIASVPEIVTAREVQRRFTQRHTTCVTGLDYYGESCPSEAVGDFFDFLPADRKLSFAIGAASGNGIPSAIVMTGLRASLRTLGPRPEGGLGSVVDSLNKLVCELAPEGFYAGMFYGQADPVLGQLKYVNAGHEPALLIRDRGRRITALRGGGTVLGLSSRCSYEQRSIAVEPGDVLIAFSEGVSEAFTSQGSIQEQIALQIEDYLDCPARQIASHLLHAADELAKDHAGRAERIVAVIRFRKPATEFALRHPIARQALAMAV